MSNLAIPRPDLSHTSVSHHHRDHRNLSVRPKNGTLSTTSHPTPSSQVESIVSASEYYEANEQDSGDAPPQHDPHLHRDRDHAQPLAPPSLVQNLGITRIPTPSPQAPPRTSLHITEPRTSSTFPHSSSASQRPSSSFDNLENTHKEKKKVSFLSRFLAAGKRRALTSTLDVDTAASSPVDHDPFAAPYAQFDDIMGNQDPLASYPKYLYPSSYVKAKSKNKEQRDFDKLFLAQELAWSDKRPTEPTNPPAKFSMTPLRGEKKDVNAIWAINFSHDGRLLAVGGENKHIKIWSVISSEEERVAQEALETEQDERASLPDTPNSALHMRASIFHSSPIRVYQDHEGAVLDLQWSKNNFLLSTSQDQTIRLYHPSRAECLCAFKHAAPVLAIAFHPKDDRFFLAGCKDGKLRLWSIPDKRIEYWVDIGEMITSVAFSPDGCVSFAGTLSGAVHTYATEKLKTMGQIPLRCKRKTKVTGLAVRALPPSSNSLKLLVTTTDSRVRLYNLNDKTLELKLKAHRNEDLPIRASINDDGRFVICPSEDRGVYLWSVSDSNLLPISDRERDKAIQRPLEWFEALSGNASIKTTCSIIAPAATRRMIAKSGDRIYEVCHPTREGSLAPSLVSPLLNGVKDAEKLTPASAVDDADLNANPDLNQARKDASTPQTFHAATFGTDESTALSHVGTVIHDSKVFHDDGLIIVTASSSGIIRIYRQDCAYGKRRVEALSRRQRYLKLAFSSQRSSASVGANDARPTSTYSFKAFSQRGFPSALSRPARADSNSSQPTRDHIERWRADIDGLSIANTNASNSSIRVVHADDSKSVQRTNSVASSAHPSSVSMSTAHTAATHMSPSRSDMRSSLAMARGSLIGNAAVATGEAGEREQQRRARVHSGATADSEATTNSKITSVISSSSRAATDDQASDRDTRSFVMSTLRIPTSGFWSSGRAQASSSQDANAESANDDAMITPRTTNSQFSRISSAFSRLTDDDLGDDGVGQMLNMSSDHSGQEIINREEQCLRCGGKAFRVKETRGWTFGKQRSLTCTRCGLECI